MRRKIGKVLIPVVLLLIVAIGIVVTILHTPALATPVGDVRTRMGSFTGPVGGTAQDDNVKASLDLLHLRVHDAHGGGSSDGSTFYVDSGVAGSAGTDWSTAVATLNAGIALCGNDHGDIILVAPGHAETISTADGVDCDISGITIIGLGYGDNRPTLTYSNANGEFVIGADDVVVKNIRFTASVTAITTAINVESGSTDYVIEDCFFDVDIDGTDEFSDCITIATASCDGGIIRNNFFDSGVKNNAGPQSWINIVDANDIQIIGNTMYGDCASACIQSETTDSYNLTIRDNLLFNGIIGGTAGLNAVECIELTGGTSGIIANNNLFCNVATSDLAIVAADCFLAGNTYNETEGGLAGSSGIGCVAGQIYTAICTTSTAFAEDLFTVTQPILIESMHGLITTQINGDAGNLHLWCDATTSAQDQTFSTAVACEGDAAGDMIMFDNTAGLSVLTPTANAGTNSAMGTWFCPIGTIEQSNTNVDATGVIVWYMSWRCLVTGTVVTPQ